jgi:hypothetical protein
MRLILPGDPLFAETLLTPRPDWREIAAKDGDTYAFIAEPGSGLMRPAGSADLEEYLYGGEYDERLEEIEEEEETELWLGATSLPY